MSIAIGEQSPLEKFQNVLSLHGQIILLSSRATKEKYEQVVNDIQSECTENSKAFAGWFSNDFKSLLYNALKFTTHVLEIVTNINAQLATEKKLHVGANLKTGIEKLEKAINWDAEKRAPKDTSKPRPEERRCNNCAKTKPISEFGANYTGGIRRICMTCRPQDRPKSKEVYKSDGNEEPKDFLPENHVVGNPNDLSTDFVAPIPNRFWSAVICFKALDKEKIQVRNEIVKALSRDTAEQYALAQLYNVDAPFCVVSKLVTEITEPK